MISHRTKACAVMSRIIPNRYKTSLVAKSSRSQLPECSLSPDELSADEDSDVEEASDFEAEANEELKAYKEAEEKRDGAATQARDDRT